MDKGPDPGNYEVLAPPGGPGGKGLAEGEPGGSYPGHRRHNVGAHASGGPGLSRDVSGPVRVAVPFECPGDGAGYVYTADVGRAGKKRPGLGLPGNRRGLLLHLAAGYGLWGGDLWQKGLVEDAALRIY